MIQSAELLKANPHIMFALVGGSAQDVNHYRKITREKDLNNIIFVTHQDRQSVPLYLHAADVLLLPNAPTSEESKHFTSPIKMFEYMASERPIIASRLPSISEVLNDNNAFLVEAGSPDELSLAIKKIQEKPEDAHHKAKNARCDVEKYTWRRHAERLMEFLKS
jgi:glycosyltransferase involved in cell wall biosynthesis